MMIRLRSQQFRGKRRFRYAVIGLGVAVVFIVAACWEGTPQRIAVVWGLGSFTGASVELESVSLTPAITMPRVALRSPWNCREQPPLAALHGLRIEYRIPPDHGRWIERFSLDSAEITFDGKQPDQLNYDFALRLLEQPASGINPLPFLPREIILHDMALDAHMPAWTGRLGGLRLAGRVVALDDLSLEIAGESAQGQWRAVNGVLPPVDAQGTLSAGIRLAGTRAEGYVQAALPGFARMEGKAAIELDAAAPGFAIDVAHAALEGPAWREIIGALSPLPLRFASLRMEDVHLHGGWNPEGLRLSKATGEVHFTALEAGAPGDPWSVGDISVETSGGLGPDSALETKVSLHQGVSVDLTVREKGPEMATALRLGPWKRADVLGLVPESWRDALAAMPGFGGVSAGGTLCLAWPEYRMDARFTPEFSGVDMPVSLSGRGTLAGGGPPWFDGKAELTLEGGNAGCAVKLGSELGVDALLRVQDIESTLLFQRILGAAGAWPVRGRITGTCAVQSAPEASYLIHADFGVKQWGYGEYALPGDAPMSVQGEARLESGGAHGVKLAAVCGEQARATVSAGRLQWTPLSGAAVIEGMADLEWLGGLLGWGGFYGEAQGRMPVRIDTGGVHADLEIRAETLGYDNWALPYGTVLTVTAALDADTALRRITFPALEAGTGAGTRLACENGALERSSDAGGWRVRLGNLVLRSDLAEAVSMGYLSSADGTAELRAEALTFAPGALAGRVSFLLDAAALAVAGDAAVVKNLHASAAMEELGGLNGAGKASAEEIRAGGMFLRQCSAGLTVTAGVAVLDIPGAALFDGHFRARAEIRLHEPGLPVHVSGSLENIDLAAFSREVKPPAVVLTGRAWGEFEASGDMSGIRELDANLRCPEGFTINRDVVQQLALYTQGIAVVGKSLQRAIGEQDPRPFDSAELTMGYRSGNTTLSVYVSSRLLDLAPVFYIKANLGELFGLMRANQLQSIERISMPRAE